MTNNPADVVLTEGEIEALADGEVLMLEHGGCGMPFRLWKEPSEDEEGWADE